MEDKKKTPENIEDIEDIAENIVKMEQAHQATQSEEAQEPQESQEPESNEEHVTQLQEELLQTRDRLMRALADAENTRKRALKDRDDAGKYAVSNFARDLLDFSDNFRRALKSLPKDTPDAVMTGLQAMDKELLNVFDRHGIRKIEPLDEPFDANFHEVMFETPVADKEPGTIIQVVEPGYVLNDRLLRAAKVGIAKAGEDTPSTPQQDPGSNVDIEG